MEFEKTIQILETFGYSDDIYSLFDHNEAEHYRKSLTFIIDFIKRAINDSDLAPLLEQKDDFEYIKYTLHHFRTNFILTSFNEEKLNIMKAYILIVKNFVSASSNVDPELKTLVDELSELINYHYSIVDAIYLLREMNKEARGFMNFKPPAFEISGHYLQSIQERLDGRR